MNASTERVILGRNLGSLEQLYQLTKAIAAGAAALKEPEQHWMVDDLQDFRRFLDSTSAVIAQLDRAVRSQIASIQRVAANVG